MRGKRAAATVKANAVGLALVKGVPAASKATGVPQRTIRDWKQQPEFAELRLSAKEAVGETMWVAIQAGIDEVYAGLRNPGEPLRSKSEALASLIEHRQLLIGEATVRSEVTHFRDYNDHERRELSAALDTLLDGAAGDRAQADSAEVRQ